MGSKTSESLNKCDDSSYTTPLEDDNHNNGDGEGYGQHYTYSFDDPLVRECASVQNDNYNKIIVRFPLKPDPTRDFKPMHHVQLYLNKQLIFHSNWLPISTPQDHAKVKAMFQQIWHEYSILTQYPYQPSPSFLPFIHHERVTFFNETDYYLSCAENNAVTSVELETKTSNYPAPPDTVPIHVQFYIGPYLVLCSESQLKNLNANTLHFVMSFILNKFMN